jgi:hypothetical protein
MKFRALIAVLLVSTYLIGGCGSILPTPTPTPTSTPVPTATPTATLPPTATRPKPTATKENALPPAIAFSLNKTQSARSMKYDYAQVLTVVEDGKTNTIPLLAVSGVDSSPNRQSNISGTSDTNEFLSYEVILIGVDAYIKGLTGVPGVDPAKWYQLPEEAQAGVRRLPSGLALIASLPQDGVAQAKFQSAGSETLNEQTCTIWAAQDAQVARALIGLTEESDMRQRMGEISKTELKLWTCADGYIHQMFGQVQGHSAQNTANTATLTLRFEMSNFDEALKIEPPADVNPFPTAPPQEQATPAAEEAASATPTAAETDSGTRTPGETESASPSATETPEATLTPTP